MLPYNRRPSGYGCSVKKYSFYLFLTIDYGVDAKVWCSWIDRSFNENKLNWGGFFIEIAEGGDEMPFQSNLKELDLFFSKEGVLC